MEVFIERTEEHPNTTWADINWHNVEENVRRLQGRIYRATMNKEWRKSEKSSEAACSSHVQQTPGYPTYYAGKQGKHTAGIDGMVYDTPDARWKLFQEGLKLKESSPNLLDGCTSLKTMESKDRWAYRPERTG